MMVGAVGGDSAPHLVRIATRASALALRQAEMVADRLRDRHPGLDVRLVHVTTTGDRHTGPLAGAGAVGAFTREVDRALLAGDADLAVHSLKDLPTGAVEGIVVAAVPAREDPADALCTRGGGRLATLPSGARIGTGSPRRRALLLARRPDLVAEAIRGNVDTRLRRLHESDRLSGIIVAVAGLTRLGRAAEITERLDPAEWLPAPGQGALAVTAPGADPRAVALARALDDEATRAATTAERAFLERVGAGCRAPIGAFARLEGRRMVLRAMLAHPDGLAMVSGDEQGAPEDAAALGARLAKRLLAGGGRELVAAARAAAEGATGE